MTADRVVVMTGATGRLGPTVAGRFGTLAASLSRPIVAREPQRP